MLAAPSFAIALPTQLEVLAGAPLNIALNGFDADGDALTFSASITVDDANLPDLVPLVNNNNRSLRITVRNTDPADPFQGDMVFELFEGRAPLTTSKIIEVAEKGDVSLAFDGGFDGMIFHRVVGDFVIQTGDPTGIGTSGALPSAYDDEFNSTLLHTSKGILSMANSGDDTNNSQFFITDGPTRFLDGNHAVFGFQTEGVAIREMVQNVPVNPVNGRPLSNVILERAEVFLDEENGVLSLIAPHGMTGTTSVTVTVSDGNEIAIHVIQVTVVADSINTDPFLAKIDDVHTTAGVPAILQLEAIDPEGDPPVFEAVSQHTELEVTLDQVTGEVTITPNPTFVGLGSIRVAVRRPTDSASFDTQTVPVFVTPAAPTGIEVVGAVDGPDGPITDTNNGLLTDDRIRFRVSGIFQETTVLVVIDPDTPNERQIAQFTAPALTDPLQIVEVEFDSNGPLGGMLADGQHVIAVRQDISGLNNIGNNNEFVTLRSEYSETIILTVDTADPVFLSTPVTTVAVGNVYTYDVETGDEQNSIAEYELLTAPDGMEIDQQTGVITWTSPGLLGFHDVIVQATDAFDRTNTQEFSVFVNAAPEFTIGIGDQDVDELTELQINFTATDPNNTPDLDEPIDTLTFSLGQGVPADAVIDPVSGVFTWTPSEEQGAETGNEFPITVIVTDSRGLSDTVEFAVTVLEINEPPMIDTIAEQTINAGEMLTVNVVVSDTDIPANDLTVEIVDPLQGMTFNHDTMQFTWTPDDAVGIGPFEVTLRVEDEGMLADEKTFVIDVNQAPEFSSGVGDQDVDELTELQINFTATDPNNTPDLDEPIDTLTFSLGQGFPADAVIDPVSGVFTWTPSEERNTLGDPVPNEFEITVIVTDSGGLTDMTSFTVTVNEVNVDPEITFDGIPFANVDEEFSLTVIVEDTDLPANNLIVSMIDPPDGAQLDPGMMPFTWVFTWTPDQTFDTSVAVIFQVDDQAGSVVTETFTIELNKLPEFGDIAPGPAVEETLFEYAVPVTDPNGPEDELTFSFVGDVPDGMTIGEHDGVIHWTPGEEDGGIPVSVTVRVEDVAGLDAETTFEITVEEDNKPPSMDEIADWIVDVGDELVVDVHIHDDDSPDDIPESTLDVTILSAPGGAFYDAANSRFRWTPTAAHGPGPFEIILQVSDQSGGMADPESFMIVVNQAPALDPIADPSVDEETELVFQITATDPNISNEQSTAEPLDPGGFDDSLTYELVDGPPGMEITANGEIRWTPGESNGPGVISAMVRAHDSRGLESEVVTVNITVREVNKPPTLAPIGDTSTFAGQMVTAQASAGDPDLPGNPLTFSLVNPPPGASIHPTTGAISFLPPNSLAGQTVGITVRVSDNGAPSLSATQSFSVSVGGTGIPPTFISNSFFSTNFLLPGRNDSLPNGFAPQGSPVPRGTSNTSTDVGSAQGGAPNFQIGPDTGVAHITEPESEEDEGDEEGDDGTDSEIRGQDGDESDENSNSVEPPDDVSRAKQLDAPEVTDSVISKYEHKTEDMVFDELIGDRWEWSVEPERWQARDLTDLREGVAPLRVLKRELVDRVDAGAPSVVITEASTHTVEKSQHKSNNGAPRTLGTVAAFAYLPLLVTDLSANEPGGPKGVLRRWRRRLRG